MQQARQLLVLPVVVLLVACGGPTFARGADEAVENRAKSLADIRSAMAGRDYPAAQAAIAQAEKLKGDPAFDAELARVVELEGYVERFWQAVGKGAKSLEGALELKIGEKIVSVVEFANGTLVLHVDGQNRRYSQKDMPAKVALTLAQQVLPPDRPVNRVFFGAFLAMDAKGDRNLARQEWDAAARGGVDVKPLLPELDTEAPAPPVEVPPVTVAMRANLNPRNWLLRTLGPKGWVRQALDDAGKQNDEGRLEVTVPESAGERVQVVCRRQFAGDFTCAVVLQNVPKSRTFGLFASGTSDEGYVVPLPAGDVLIEFARRAGEVKCRLNRKEVEVQTLGTPSARLAGYLGLTAAGGDQFTIAAVEMAGR